MSAAKNPLVLCACRCHDKGATLKHNVACCSLCPHCGSRIKLLAYDEHVKKCAPNPKA